MQETLVQFLGWEDQWRKDGYPLKCSWASLVAQLVKNPPVIRGDLGSVPGLGRSLEKGKVTHSSILTWRIPRTV